MGDLIRLFPHLEEIADEKKTLYVRPFGSYPEVEGSLSDDPEDNLLFLPFPRDYIWTLLKKDWFVKAMLSDKFGYVVPVSPPGRFPQAKAPWLHEASYEYRYQRDRLVYEVLVASHVMVRCEAKNGLMYVRTNQLKDVKDFCEETGQDWVDVPVPEDSLSLFRQCVDSLVRDIINCPPTNIVRKLKLVRRLDNFFAERSVTRRRYQLLAEATQAYISDTVELMRTARCPEHEPISLGTAPSTKRGAAGLEKIIKIHCECHTPT